MNTLKDLSLESICLNLSLNSKLNDKYSCIIPPKVSDEIFNFITKYKRVIDSNEMKFFNSKHLKLSLILIRNDKFLTSNYMFLNGYQLNDLHLEKIEKFNINLNIREERNFRIITKNLIIKNCKFFNGNLNDTQYFLENCITAKESIFLRSINNPEFHFNISKLIEKSNDTIKILNFTDTFIIDKDLNNFTDILGKLSILEEFSLIQSYSQWTLMRTGSCFMKNILFALSNCSDTLKKISIPKTCYFANEFIELIKKLRNLEDISLILNYRYASEEIKVLTNLTKYRSKSLKNLKIDLDCYDVTLKNYISQLVNNCNQLEYFKLFMGHRILMESVIKSLDSSVATLKKIEVPRFVPSLAKIFEKCSSLVTINATGFNMSYNILESITKAIKLSKNSLSTIKFDSLKGTNFFLKGILESLCLVSKMTEITIRYSFFDDKAIKILSVLINKHNGSLKLLDLSHSNLARSNICQIQESLVNCRDIEILRFNFIKFSKSEKFILPNFAQFFYGLKELSLENCNLQNDHFEILSQIFLYCRNLELLNMYRNVINKKNITQLLKSLRWSRKSLKTFNSPKLLNDKQCDILKEFFLSSTHLGAFVNSYISFNDEESNNSESGTNSHDSSSSDDNSTPYESFLLL